MKQQWSQINWEEAESYINKLQLRIVKAVNKDKWRLVKRLQYLITHSYYGKALAIRKVTTNKGKNTPGIDGVLLKSDNEKMKAMETLDSKGYKSSALKRVYIEKYGKKEKRPLGIPTMRDRAMQALYLLSLEPISETTVDITSFGFRKYRSAHDAKKYGFSILCRKDSAQWILEGDIKGCFDNISHQWLMDYIPMDKKVLKQFIKSGHVYKRRLYPTKSGTPQGGLC